MIRSNLSIFDEAGKITRDFFSITEPFTTQSADFKTGPGFDENIYPKQMPNQTIYCSSAETIDSHLYIQYKQFAKNMMIGLPGFFCCDLGCQLPLNPTINGEKVLPLLAQSEVDSAMRANESRAMREYHNIFDTDGTESSVVSRSMVLRNEFGYLPYDEPIEPGEHYAILWDPALIADRSFYLIVKYWRDIEKGWKARIVNGVNLIRYISPTEKLPLRTEEQQVLIREALLKFNGFQEDGSPASEWDNVILYIDAGPGGAGLTHGDTFLLPWVDEKGESHKGICDMKYDNASYVEFRKSKSIVPDVLRLIEPTKYKPIIFNALSEMMSNNYIEMPRPLPPNGVYELEDGSKHELTREECRALLEIDLMKEEIISIEKKKTTVGNIIYQVASSKEKKVGDDRAYVCSLAAYHLSELRRKDLTYQKKSKKDWDEYLAAIGKQSQKSQVINPFGNIKNPFANRNNPFGGQ